MKNKYKILRIIVISEFILGFILSKFFELKVTSFWGVSIGIILVFAPLLYWLYLASKDDSYSTTKRTICKIVLAFISFTIVVSIFQEYIKR